MINKLYPFLFMLLIVVSSCGGDEEEPKVKDKGGEIAVTVNGVLESFGSPLFATLRDLAYDEGTALDVYWEKDDKSLNIHLDLNVVDLDCFPTGRINLLDLPEEICFLEFYYTTQDIFTGSASSVYLEEGRDGWIDIISCDSENDIISIEFEFDAIQPSGNVNVYKVRGGSAVDMCFTRKF